MLHECGGQVRRLALCVAKDSHVICLGQPSEMENARGMAKLYVVTGTDTGVGKTVVTSSLLAALQARARAHGHAGRHVGLKPFETGCWRQDDQWVGEDGVLHARYSSDSSFPNGVYRFEPPVGPTVAARQAGVVLTLEPVLALVERARQQFEQVLVEGVGGLMVPLNDHETVLDLIRRLRPDGVLLVSTNRLGMLSQVLSAHYILRAEGLPLLGVVLTPGPEPESLAAQTNVEELRRYVSPVICCPRVEGEAARASAGEVLWQALEQHGLRL